MYPICGTFHSPFQGRQLCERLLYFSVSVLHCTCLCPRIHLSVLWPIHMDEVYHLTICIYISIFTLTTLCTKQLLFYVNTWQPIFATIINYSRKSYFTLYSSGTLIIILMKPWKRSWWVSQWLSMEGKRIICGEGGCRGAGGHFNYDNPLKRAEKCP